MFDLRIGPTHFTATNGGTSEFGRMFQAGTTFPLRDVLSPDKCIDPFQRVVGRLRAGDTVELVRVRNGELDRSDTYPLEFARTLITQVDPPDQRDRHVSFTQTSEVLFFADETSGVAVERRGSGGLWVIRQDGRDSSAKYNTRDEAVRVAAALGDWKSPTPAASGGKPKEPAKRRCGQQDFAPLFLNFFVPTYEARIVGAIEDVLADPDYFSTVGLRPGSLLNIVQYATDEFDAVVAAISDVVVRWSRDGRLELHPSRDIARSGIPAETGLVRAQTRDGRFAVRRDGITLERFESATQAGYFLERLQAAERAA